METALHPGAGFAEGDPIVVVSYRDEWARLFHATIDSIQPFSVLISTEESTAFESATETVLLTTSEQSPQKAQALVQSSESTETGLRVAFEPFEWVLVDRRRHPRIPMKLPVELQLVEETESGPKITTRHAFTEDMSLGGAWVQMENPLPKDALIEFRTWPANGSLVRTLAVVMHSSQERQGVGLEFVNFIGPSKLALEEFLSAA